MLQVMKYDTEVESLSKQVKDLERYKLWHAHPVFLFYFILLLPLYQS
jgi:hypothetical protein